MTTTNCWNWWNWKSRELLTKYEFDGDNLPVIKGSALKAIEAQSPDDEGAASIQELLDALDKYIEEPERDTAKPFLMPVEDVFSIEGRGTVVTGKNRTWRGENR